MSDELILEFEDEYIGSAVSPTVDITETTDDITVTITDFRGEHSYSVDKTDQAITNAEQAATNANTAAANATSTANAAAQYARTTADQAAEAAKTAANTAAGQATTAATNATTAAGTANTAATNADTKAQLADTAATNADAATQAANTATTAATNAAQAANNAADVAIEAAEDMPRLIGTVDTAQAVADAWPTTMEGATLYGKCVQDGTPTPDNPVPVQVVGGANLISLTPYKTGLDWYNKAAGYTFTPGTSSDTTVTVDGADVTIESANTWRGVVYVSDVLTAGKTYTVSVAHGESTGTIGRTVYVLDANHTVTRQSNNHTDNPLTRLSEVITLANGEAYIAFCIGLRTTAGTVTFSQLQVREGSLVLPFVPYGCIGLQTGETVNAIDMQGHTLAGGDVLKIDSAGRVWIEDGADTITLDGSEYWSAHGSIASWFYVDGLISAYKDNARSDVAKCDRFVSKPYTAAASLENGELCVGYPSGDYSASCRIVIKNTACTTAADFKTWLASNPTTIVYRTAAHQTIELGTITPPDIAPGDTLAIYASLDPEWAIEYTQDPSIVVNTLQSSIAPVEGATASANYSVGAYLIHGNQLYRVTSAIATGEAITPDSNCVACTVMGEVIRLTA